MGGGSTSDEDPDALPSPHVHQQPARPAAAEEAGVLSAVSVITCASAVAFALLGMGTRTGLLVGALVGSYAAARSDDVGHRTRVATGQIVDSVADNQVVRSVSESVRAKANEYQVTQRLAEIQPAVNKTVHSGVLLTEQVILPTAASFASKVHEKLKEIESTREVFTQAEAKVVELDEKFGVSSAVQRTTHTILEEIKQKTAVP